MNRQLPRRKKASLFLMTARRRLLRSWTSWRLKATRKRLVREELRLRMLLLQSDLQLLYLKELQERALWLEHKELEMQGAQELRLQQIPPAPPVTMPELEEELILLPPPQTP